MTDTIKTTWETGDTITAQALNSIEKRASLILSEFTAIEGGNYQSELSFRQLDNYLNNGVYVIFLRMESFDNFYWYNVYEIGHEQGSEYVSLYGNLAGYMNSNAISDLDAPLTFYIPD